MTRLRRKRLITAVVSLLIILSLAAGGLIIAGFVRKSLYPLRYQEYVEKYSAEYGIPRELVYSVILCESSFREDIVSYAGAVGLMQLMPDTFDWLQKLMKEEYNQEDIYNPEINIKCGVFYLSYLYNRFEDWDTALAGYNAGHNRVSAWLADTRYSDDRKTLKHIPFADTRNYVEKVNRVKGIYTDLYFDN